MSGETYRALMRHQAGAVTVIATARAGQRAGLTATAVSSLSDMPPTILACVHRKAVAHDLILSARTFSVNLLAREQQEVAERFAGRHGLAAAERFAGLDWTTLKTGAPILIDALASLDCELTDHHRFTTHSIFVGRAVAGQVRAEAAPLLYFRGDFWNLGQA
jgi:flavin reductase (DIM6/NTAB) family NADH-FMN oxidoreductase RutF